MDHKYALIISIEHYKDSLINTVRFAQNDGNELRNTLLSIGYKDENITLLIDDDATKTLIEAKVKKILKSLSKNDALIIFFAGHGFTKNNHNYITCYDTLYGDLMDTSISLQYIFKQVRGSNSKKFIFFLDTCHSGLEIDESMRDLYSDMTEDELKEFFERSEYYIAFASSKFDEVSHSATALSHGIWSYHLLEALKGNVKSILKNKRYVTATELQNYLSIEVPKAAKKYTTKGYQNPIMFGNLSSEFIVADLTNLMEEKKRKRQASPLKIDRTLFSYEIVESIKMLSGFNKKFHKVPDYISNSTENFVKEKADEDIVKILDSVNERIKESFDYKRKEIVYEKNHGEGRISTPDFEFIVTINQSSEKPSEYVERLELFNISSDELLNSDSFNNVFKSYFDTIEFSFQNRLDIKNFIDTVQEIESDSIRIDYPPDCSYCELDLDGIETDILVTANSLKLIEKQLQPPKQLINSLIKIRKELLKFEELKRLG